MSITAINPVAIDLSRLGASDITNLATILICVAVLVQSVRMMRSLKTMRESTLAEAAEALDRATTAANQVLGELKRTLLEDGRATAEVLREGAALREELIVMVGIANSVAERLVDANRDATGDCAELAEPVEPALHHEPDNVPLVDVADSEARPVDDRRVNLAAIVEYLR
ncbi:MAG: hypothetical protein ACK5SX_08945 [Sandaracinobacter sp.]